MGIADFLNPKGKIFELGLSILIGLLLGLLVVFDPYLPLPHDFQMILLAIPFAIIVAILFNNLEKLVLAAIAIGLPLNWDISVMISPYARNLENITNGQRTIMALTELRVSLTLIVVAIGYVLWLIKPWGTEREPVRFFPATTLPALGIIAISVLSVFQAQDTQLSIFKIVQLIELFLMYFYLANHIRTKQDLQFFIVVLLGGVLAESILMIVQWFTGLSFSIAGISANYNPRIGRTEGTLGTADAAGGIIAAHLAIASVMVWLFPRRSQKVFAVVCIVMGCIALVSTGSRAAWISFAAAIFGIVLVGLWRGWVKGRSVGLFFTMALVIGVIFSPAIYHRLTAYDHGSAASRPKMFRLAWNVIQASPAHMFLGIGANNYALVAPAYNTAEVGNLGYVIDSSVHDAYLLAWAETGLLGMLLFISFVSAPLLRAWTHIKSVDRFNSLLALGLGCALLAMSIQMLVDPFILRPKNLFVWMLVALIASLDNLESSQVGPAVGQVQGT